jgi:orotidine-5'-phosphate decarboxylase
MLTIHAAGGRSMIEACAAAVRDLRDRPLILAVTILTSLSDGDLLDIGWSGKAEDQAVRLALLARDAGADGVVASPLEIEAIRVACGLGFAIVTPGIRSQSDAASDQQRTATAAEAIRRGADYIVVGRPITAASDPAAAAKAMLTEIAENENAPR